MKRDLELVRELLLKIEEHTSLQPLKISDEERTNEIQYHLNLMNKSRFNTR
jgi:hypothetical protein